MRIGIFYRDPAFIPPSQIFCQAEDSREVIRPSPGIINGMGLLTPANTNPPASLPSGTVTFLFTDIEGSTKLWEQHPESMRTALEHHDALMREAIGSCGGSVFKTMGDAFCAVFPAAPGALAAAIKAQLSLLRESWPDPVSIRVRMALHTGIAQERDGDYFGPVLNRVARLCAAGHGGQTLVSTSSHDLLLDHLPEEVGLRDLGAHRFKDLERAERVYQITHPEL
ncbi:MAG: adenylate/guanylate cyclase domain-containing protein, partial [Akkermansiaceae bacterium]|nr:adenylate/guanylate cyclase domain-containing protein [Armatimonadota bacterium]